jgi:hypothetical protein
MMRPWFSAIGLVVLGGIAVGLLRGLYPVDVAATRAVIVFIGLVFADRLLGPVIESLVGRPAAPGIDDPDDRG